MGRVVTSETWKFEDQEKCSVFPREGVRKHGQTRNLQLGGRTQQTMFQVRGGSYEHFKSNQKLIDYYLISTHTVGSR